MCDPMEGMVIRHAEPADYQPIIAVVNDWWGGRNMRDMLPKLFFIHFRPTSFVAQSGEAIVGFLVGLASQTFSDAAYIHFVGVHPEFRQKGLGRALYERFFQAAGLLGRRKVSCVTSPLNQGSIAFHLRMGFSLESSEKIVEKTPVAVNYDGPGGDRVLFSRIITA
ncbi:MAG: GNAT family N-acetyltransferase [Thermodesulfobacteriota bacterium]